MPAFWNNRPLRCDPPCLSQPKTDRLRQPAQPLTGTLDLDARTDWPTHRIRSFLSMQDASGAQARTGR